MKVRVRDLDWDDVPSLANELGERRAAERSAGSLKR
jgi:hypothetical protein